MRAAWLCALLLASLSRAGTVAITGATVWTNASDVPIENATLVLRAGRIVSLQRGGAPPPDAAVIAAAGGVVTPLLDAAATQIGLVELASASDTDDRAVSGGLLGAAFDVSLGVDPNDLTIQQARASGIGRALVFPGPAGSGIFAGQAARLNLAGGGADAIALVERPRVALFVSAGGSAARAAGGSRAAVCGLLRNALAEAQSLKDAPSAFKPRDQLQNHADLEALLPVLQRRAPLAVCAQREADIREAVAVARQYGLSLVIVGGAEAWRTAELLATRHVPVVLDPLEDLPTSYDLLGARRDNAALLARAGVLIGFSVSGQGIYLSYDVGPALREGAGIAVANGLPYAQALRAITANAGRIWGDPVAHGVLAPGEPADLVLWDGDPLEPASAPRMVFHGGEPVSLRTRQSLLRDRYRPASAAPATTGSR